MFDLHTYIACLHTSGHIKISQAKRGHEWKKFRKLCSGGQLKRLEKRTQNSSRDEAGEIRAIWAFESKGY